MQLNPGINQQLIQKLFSQQCAEEEINDNHEQQLFFTGHTLAPDQPFQLLHLESKLFVTAEPVGDGTDALCMRLTEGESTGSTFKFSPPTFSGSLSMVQPLRDPPKFRRR